MVSDAAESFGNMFHASGEITADRALAYTPRLESRAVDSAISAAPNADPATIAIRAFQPLLPLSGTVRVMIGRPDAGAFETCR